MKGAIDTPYELKRIAIVSEAINQKPIEGIRKYSKELSSAFEACKKFSVYRVGFSEEIAENGGSLAKFKEIIHCRRKLKEIDPDITIYIPSSPRIIMNLLKILLWKGKSRRNVLILLQPPTGMAPFARRILNGVILYRQFDSKLLPPSLQERNWKVIPSGANTSHFKPITKNEKDKLKIQYGFSPGDRIILSVGHLTEGRNLNLIMKISKTITAKTIFVTNEIRADDPVLKTQLKESGVIIFDRYLEKIQDLYSISDCYVFPTVNPGSAIGMPLSILEALSCNIPVVSAKFGIIHEILKEEDGITFFNDDESAIMLIRKIISETSDNYSNQSAINFGWNEIVKKIISEM